tara:strand:+ start:142 stop:771 length:630 start_codon:yes stop_codon:yes gene_type:complete
MKQIVLFTQGSQAIQLVRKFFELGYKPEQFLIFTNSEIKNKCFIEFILYYKIDFLFEIKYQLIKDNAIVISYSNLHKINIFPNATFINFHPGLLPKYKGSLSTVHSMINNEKEVGGTWHYMTNKIDHGNVLCQFNIDITDSDTAFSLNHKIFNESVNYLSEVLHLINNNNTGYPQTHNEGKFYYNKFPNISHLNTELQKRINYFPPKFK